MSDNAVSRRLRRVFSMNRDEFFTRSRQEIGKRLDGALAKVGYDFSEVPRTTGTGPKFFFDPQDVPAILALLQQRLPGEYNQIVPRAERICARHFDLLGYRDLDYGKSIDWSLDRVHGKRAPHKLFYKLRYLDFAECGDVKVTWELNRHQHFLALVKAFRITGDQRFADEFFAQWKHWQQENPYPRGVNWASSLEYAFRSLSWLWTYYLLGEVAQQRTGFCEQFLRSLSVHGRAIERYLSTYFSPNTHLLGEAVALFFIGVLCPELPSADRWKTLGWSITLQEAQRQVRPDGLHFEQSLYYHVYAIDFFLHARILASRNGIVVPAGYDQTIERMLNALSVLGRTGNVPRIGDDDGGRLFDGQRNRPEHMLDPLATGAVLFHRGDFKAITGGLREETLWLLGPAAATTFDSIREKSLQQDSMAFVDSGLYVMNAPARQIVIDAGPVGAGSGGHGHADALSVCVSDNSGPVLIDSGTLEYVGEDRERERFRSTPAHNAITIDGIGQPEPRGPFAWSRHPESVAEKWINGERFDFFVGSQDAYRSSSIIHRRFVFSVKSGFWLVRDVLDGYGKHNIDSYWHLAPEFHPASGNRFVRNAADLLDVITPEGNLWSREIEAGSWSPVYGQVQQAPVLHFSTVASLPTEFVTLFKRTADAQGVAGNLTESASGSGARGYAYAAGGEEHQFVFGDGKIWQLNSWASNADFLYWALDRRRGSGMLICCGGTQLTFAGQPLLEYSKGLCEVFYEDGESQSLGTNRDSVSINGSVLQSLADESILSDVAAVAADRLKD